MSDTLPKQDLQASRERLDHYAKQHIFKHAIPTEYGGLGDNYAQLVKAHDALGKESQDSGLILSINAHLWGIIYPVLNHGTVEQKQQYLPDLLSGKVIGGQAITEPQAGSDLNNLQTTAVATENGYQLNGCKRFITNTPIANVMVVYALVEERLAAFIVHANDDGAFFGDAPSVSGCHTATMGDVVLENCLLPKSRLLGKLGAGKMIIHQALELERGFIFAGIMGIMSWQLQTIIQHTRQRQIGDAHLGKHQAISHKVAEMKLRLDTIRLWVNECARLKDTHQRITLASAQTKLFAAEAFVQSSLDSVQIMGAAGLTKNHPINQLINDALASRLFSGSSEIQKNIIAALAGTGDGYMRRTKDEQR